MAERRLVHRSSGAALKDEGKYYASLVPTQAKGTPDAAKQNEKRFEAKLAERPDLYGKAIKTSVLAPEYVDLAPPDSADMVLTFRNVHNWAKGGYADAMFKAFYDVLKPGGILGVVDHRAKPGTGFGVQARSGYLTEDYVIGLPEGRFQLIAGSEVNANPKDTKDYTAACGRCRRRCAWAIRTRRSISRSGIGPHDAQVREAGEVMQGPRQHAKSTALKRARRFKAEETFVKLRRSLIWWFVC